MGPDVMTGEHTRIRLVADEIDPRFGLRRLYIALTRAVSGLTVVHARPLPEPLAA